MDQLPQSEDEIRGAFHAKPTNPELTACAQALLASSRYVGLSESTHSRQDYVADKISEGLLEYDHQLHRATHTYRYADPYVRERIAGDVYEWNWLAKSLGIKAGVIISKVRNRRTHVFVRWPLYLPFGLSQVVTGSLLVQDLIPSLPKVVSRPQNVMSSESKVFKACESGNIAEIQKLLKDRQFHPNDRTPDDLTVFRVRWQAIEEPSCHNRINHSFQVRNKIR